MTPNVRLCSECAMHVSTFRAPLEVGGKCATVLSLKRDEHSRTPIPRHPFDVFGALRPAHICTSEPVQILGVPSIRDSLYDDAVRITDDPIDSPEHARSISTDKTGDLDDREATRVIAQRGHDGRVKRRDALQRAMETRTCTLLLASATSPVHLLPDIARRARRDQITQVIGAPFTVGHNMVDMQDDVWRELSAVATGELVAFEHDPTSEVPSVGSLPLSSHRGIVSHFAHFAHFYHIGESVR